MKPLIILAALTALTACGVGGAPIKPGSQDELATPPNASPRPANGVIGGTMSVHTAAVL